MSGEAKTFVYVIKREERFPTVKPWHNVKVCIDPAIASKVAREILGDSLDAYWNVETLKGYCNNHSVMIEVVEIDLTKSEKPLDKAD